MRNIATASALYTHWSHQHASSELLIGIGETGYSWIWRKRRTDSREDRAKDVG